MARLDRAAIDWRRRVRDELDGLMLGEVEWRPWEWEYEHGHTILTNAHWIDGEWCWQSEAAAAPVPLYELDTDHLCNLLLWLARNWVTFTMKYILHGRWLDAPEEIADIVSELTPAETWVEDEFVWALRAAVHCAGWSALLDPADRRAMQREPIEAATSFADV